MSAATVVESLLTLGMTIKDAFTKANKNGNIDWAAFVGSQELEDVQAEIQGLVRQLTANDIKSALGTIAQKKTALLGGKPTSALPPDKLLQFFDLLTAEGVLVRQELQNISQTATFFEWLVDEALPKLVSVAKVVVPLLL